MNRRGLAVIGAVVMLGCSGAKPPRGPAEAPRSPGTHPPELGPKLAGLERRAGLFDLYVDRAAGKVFAVLPAATGPRGRIAEILYTEGITTGLGSNPVGLDRGQLGDTQVLDVRRVGARVLFEAQNLRYRAQTDDAAERATVRESFATSVIWSGEVLAEDLVGRTLVDLTSFLVRDAHDVAQRLAQAGQGNFSLDRERSAVDLDACLAFPKNLEFESVLTWSGGQPGPEVRATAPDPQAVTLVQHQSLLALPPDGYRPRAYDSRMGSFSIEFADYATPLDKPVAQRWIVRHRLERTDPKAAHSPAREPIVYYVDRGAPEPIRSALVEGASWWAKAFAAAGFDDAYRVELLPEGAHPLDARYNVVQWVHRATRGWSYGGGITDPRTGEMIKGHVTLGSLRIRQDRLLFEGLAGIGRTGSGAADDPVVLSLARIRQLAAHEVGHTLGFAHNFAASSYGRASVMDYPAPLVDVTADGQLDFSQAYTAGIGEWDIAATRWAYSEFAPGTDENRALDAIARDAVDRGMIFLSDVDARSPSTGNPIASLWDNGADPVAALQESMRVRRVALARFGENNIAEGQSLAGLEEVFVPVYLHHRYQAVAAAKVVGGLEYRHALRGDGEPPAKPVGGDRQRRAIAALLDTVTPSALDIPESALRLLLPRTPEMGRNREQFGNRSEPAFDAMGAAATAADLTLRLLLDPARSARMVDFHRRNAALPDFSELLATAIDHVFADTAALAPREAELARVTQRVLVERMIDLSADNDAATWVRARVDLALSDLLQRIDQVSPLDTAERSHFDALGAEIGRYLARPSAPREPSRTAAPEPPGEPIGSAPETLGECDFGAGV